MLRFLWSLLNLAPRSGDGGHPVFSTALGGHLRRLLVVGTALSLATCSRPRGSIVIALAGPFSQPRGASMLRAAQLAVNQINAHGGVRGNRLELRVADDSGSEDTAVRVAETLYADPTVVAVVGHLSSGPSLAAARVYGGGGTPVVMISPSASSPDLSGLSPFVFRVCPSDLQHGPRLARFAWQTLGARRAGIIYINSDYGRGVRGTFAAEFTRLGGSVVEADPYVATTPSLEPYLSRMRRGGVDVLVLAAERPGAELALREMRALGFTWPVLGGDALTGIEADGALAEGVRISSAYLPDRRDERNAAFVADYARAYPGMRPDNRGAGAYDAVFLLARAIGDAGPSRPAIRARLAEVGHGRPAFDGVTGTIAFDGNGDVPAKTVVIGIVRNAQLVTQAEP
ncbi:MAG TPA: ABC transporter substrate-binding protein [Gemmatimonadales bacterium]|nr:ABC transporter substrate-binding protein [Gemmatimonadales bacterium]